MIRAALWRACAIAVSLTRTRGTVRGRGGTWAMAVVTSIINLKGGVGKTTITIALAHYLAGEHAKRVLVIDLDPQTNATIAMVNERRWRERDQSGQTLYQLFKDQLDGTQVFSAQESVMTRV